MLRHGSSCKIRDMIEAMGEVLTYRDMPLLLAGATRVKRWSRSYSYTAEYNFVNNRQI